MSAKAPTRQQVKTFLDKVDAARKGDSPGPVFVHCAHGSDRTGCLVGIWRVVNDGWGYDEAYAEMRKYYFGPKFTKLSGTVKSYAQDKTASR
jgi:protein tyrosine/serine phosphatase